MGHVFSPQDYFANSASALKTLEIPDNLWELNPNRKRNYLYGFAKSYSDLDLQLFQLLRGQYNFPG